MSGPATLTASVEPFGPALDALHSLMASTTPNTRPVLSPAALAEANPDPLVFVALRDREGALVGASVTLLTEGASTAVTDGLVVSEDAGNTGSGEEGVELLFGATGEALRGLGVQRWLCGQLVGQPLPRPLQGATPMMAYFSLQGVPQCRGA